MAEQLSFNSPEDARDEAIERVKRHASPSWIEAGIFVGEHLARKIPCFVAAEIDLEMQRIFPNIKTHDKRAMVAVIRRLERDGVIAPTEKFTPDPRTSCHARPVRVWRSLIFKQAA